MATFSVRSAARSSTRGSCAVPSARSSSGNTYKPAGGTLSVATSGHDLVTKSSERVSGSNATDSQSCGPSAKVNQIRRFTG